MSHAKSGPFTNGAPPALNKGTLDNMDSQYDDAMADVAAGYVVKGALFFNVKNYGALGDGSTDDTTAIGSAITAAIAAKGVVFFPPGTYMSQGHTLTGASGIGFEMQGTLKRVNSGPATALLFFSGCSNVTAGTIRTDGNIANNGVTVAVGKQDVTLDGCTNVTIGQILSTNTASDSLYITNACSKIRVGYVSSICTSATGRNAVSIIQGDGIIIGDIYSVNTGTNLMPGGLDIEPNSSANTVNNVHIGSLTYTGVGTQGLSLYSQYGQIITNVSIGRVILHKLSGTASGANDVYFAGVKNLYVGYIQHLNDVGTNQAVNIDNCDNINVTMNVNGGLKGVQLGPTAAVTNFKLFGSITGTASHGLYIYAASNGLIDMNIKNVANGFVNCVKNVAGTSDNVRFRGDWSKASTGSQVMSASGLTTGVTNWVLDGLDLRGWASGTLFQNGSVLQGLVKLNCRGVNFGTAAPTGTDQWGVGDEVKNSAPAVGSPKAWVCTVAGTPGTWVSTGNL